MSPYFHGGHSLSAYLRAEEVVEILKDGGYLRKPYIHWCAYTQSGTHVGRMTWTTLNAVRKRVKTKRVLRTDLGSDNRIELDGPQA